MVFEMAFIYVITNQINNKQYIGKTNSLIEKRFQEHICDSRKSRCEKRPLYDAMNKYGTENFSVKRLEECPSKMASEREIYWIDKLNTYHDGYNATKGGDGKVLYNYKEIAKKYKELKTIRATAEFFSCDIETVRKACVENKVKIISAQEHSKNNNSKRIIMLPDNIIFNSVKEAAFYLQKNCFTKQKDITGITSHIRKSANGQRKSAYQHSWQRA